MSFLLLFILLAALAILSSSADMKVQKMVLALALVMITFMIGFRDVNITPDAIVYKMSFDQSPNISTINKYSEPFGYGEMGFFYLGVIIKSITSNYQIYFTIYAGLTMFVFYKFLDKYATLPLLGLCDYYSRFLGGRDFIQMRSALSILLVMFALQYAYKKKLIAYLIILYIAYTIHHSAFVALPFYFINLIKFKRRWIVYGLVISAILAVVFAPFVSGFLMTLFADSTYMSGDADTTGKGLGNPMIYWQVIILLLYTFNEKKLSKIIPAYYTLRTAYFYSTCILVMFCNYAIVAGRGSTMFATVEVIILPAIALSYNKGKRLAYIIAAACLLFTFLFLKSIGGESISL